MSTLIKLGTAGAIIALAGATSVLGGFAITYLIYKFIAKCCTL